MNLLVSRALLMCLSFRIKYKNPGNVHVGWQGQESWTRLLDKTAPYAPIGFYSLQAWPLCQREPWESIGSSNAVRPGT